MSFRPLEKTNPLKLNESELLDVIRLRGAKSISKHISECLQGISPQSAAAIVFAALGETDLTNLTGAQEQTLASYLLHFFSMLENGQLRPYTDGHTFSCIPTNEVVQYYESVNEMLDAFFFSRVCEESMKREKAALKKPVVKQIDKLERRLAINTETLEDSKHAPLYKQYGDLLSANIYRLKKGLQSVTLQNFYENMAEVQIPLNVAHTPAKNAQDYYKKYNKAKVAAEISKQQINETSAELDYLRSLEVSIETVSDKPELDEVRYDLIKAGYIAERSVGKKKKTKVREECSQPLQFVSSDGGIRYTPEKNNRQNDLVTPSPVRTDGHLAARERPRFACADQDCRRQRKRHCSFGSGNHRRCSKQTVFRRKSRGGLYAEKERLESKRSKTGNGAL